MNIPIYHPMTGDGYYPMSDDALAAELDGAEIVEQNDMFGTFTLIVGYRDKAFSTDGKTAEPFVCIKNHTHGLPHLFICKED
jgi:hypothetical protein